MLRDDLVKEITDFADGSPDNSLRSGKGADRAWGRPLVGFSNGDDPIYAFLQKDIGDFWWTPLDAFRKAFPKERGVAPDRLTVITWALPHTPEIIAAQRLEREMPSEDWARARLYGEIFNDLLRKHMVEWLAEAGCESVAPTLSPEYRIADSQKYVFAASWSERHAAYVGGLGTFGLCDGLITPIGKAVRFGSVVARLDVPPTTRAYRDMNEYCLYYSHGACMQCARRCPARAISERGHDKTRCSEFVHGTIPYIAKNWGLKTYGCGLCQTGVPCETGIPLRSGVSSAVRAT